MPLTHLGCPSCGGTLSLAVGQRLVTCRYCGGESLVLIPGAVPRHLVALEVSMETARAAAQEFLRKGSLPRTLRERGRIQEVSLCYVPFYEFTGSRLGTFLLREGVKPPAPLGEEAAQDGEFQRWLAAPSVEKEDTRVIQQEYVRIGPACDLPELGVGQIHLENLRRGSTPVALEPYDLVALQSRAVVFAPTKPPARFADESRLRIKVKGDRTGVVEERLKILYYPVWQARYRHAGRPYEIAVDGVTGAVLRARGPVEIRQAAAVAVAALALAALCFGRPARHLVGAGLGSGPSPGWVLDTLGTLLALAMGGIVAMCLAWVGWTTFRRGGELLLVEDGAQPVLAAGLDSGVLGGAGTRLVEWLLAHGMRSGGRG
ncbi:MAG: hypothetical protein HY766_10570 [candidate division NC10 bacterium]|nr:hypothetical protein [candidate division NC10 bacterium]